MTAGSNKIPARVPGSICAVDNVDVVIYTDDQGHGHLIEKADDIPHLLNITDADLQAAVVNAGIAAGMPSILFKFKGSTMAPTGDPSITAEVIAFFNVLNAANAEQRRRRGEPKPT